MDLADFGGDAKGPVHLDTPPTMPGTPTEELHDGLTVGELARQISALPPCAIQLSLREAAQMLLSSGQAAGCVVDESGSPVGVITEDDILHSYVQGAPWDTTVGEWLRGGGGVLFDETSGAASPTARVASEQPLHAALPALVSGQRIVPSLGRSSGRSALLVERQGNYAGGVLSALDVVQALAQRASEKLMGALAGTVADVMEPIDQAPRLQVGFTMRDLLKELLRTPLRAALVLDEQGHMGGLAMAADALWAFNQQMSQTLDAWERLSSRPGRLAPQICTSAALSSACSAFEREGARAPLLATEPDTGDVVGLVAPSHMVEAGRRRPSRHPVPSCAPGLKQERIRKVKEERPIKEENTGVAVKLEEEVKCEEPAPKKRAVMTKPKLEIKMEDSAVPAPPPPSLAEIVARRDTALCDIEMSLTDAVDALVCSGRTAAVVLDNDQVQGVLTENDVLAALVEGTPWECKIMEWLRGGYARLPGFLVPALTLSSSASVVDAAAEMTTLVEDGMGFACHHLLVYSKAQAQPHRILSALDIARGMVEIVLTEAEDEGLECQAAKEAAMLTVEQVMKERETVSTCRLGDSLHKAFEEMHSSKQNCVLIVGGDEEFDDGDCKIEIDDLTPEEQQWQKDHGRVYGVITAADAVRAFSEHLRGNTSTVAGWLRALAKERPPVGCGSRSVRSDVLLSEAADIMAEAEVHHLLVRDASTGDNGEVVGVISALDIVCALGASYRFDLTSPRFV